MSAVSWEKKKYFKDTNSNKLLIFTKNLLELNPK